MEKDFDNWNSLKKRLDKKFVTYCHEGEIWWCSIGINIGHEENGKNINFERPVLILKIFSKDLVCIIPSTSKIKNRKYYFKLFFKGKYSSIILSQVRVISPKRLLRKITQIDKFELRKIKRTLKYYLLN